MRTSVIRVEVNPNLHETDLMYVVDLYDDGVLVESRRLPNKSRYYAEDLSENWDTGLIEYGK